MSILRNWLSAHRLQVYAVTFLLMTVPAIALYFAASREASGWIVPLLALIVTGNLLVLFT